MCNFISVNFKSRFIHDINKSMITNDTQLATVIYATKVKLLRRVSNVIIQYRIIYYTLLYRLASRFFAKSCHYPI